MLPPVRSRSLSLLVLAATSCTPTPRAVPEPVAPSEPPVPASTPTREAFGASAFVRVQTLMELPRGLGAPGRAASIDRLEQMLKDVGAAQVVRLPTSADDPATGASFDLVSLVGHVRPQAPRRFVLATHFDTRPWADESPDAADHDRPVPGANDGTSGVAVVLELSARLGDVLPPDVGWTVILFDGEELGRPTLGGYCMGSKDLARRQLAQPDPILARAELGIVFDMVGDVDLQLPVEPGSAAIHPQLVAHVWDTAAAMGARAFDPTPRTIGVIDDHRFLTEAGIPSILLIDREYAPWHTLDDTIAHVSADSLGTVGEVTQRALASWFAR